MKKPAISMPINNAIAFMAVQTHGPFDLTTFVRRVRHAMTV